MLIRSKVGRAVPAIGGLVMLGGLVGFALVRNWLDIANPLPSNDGATEVATGGFRELARQAGLNFRMQFLPNEQGETFKVNLYDHGCGLAVADFDGDGHEDIYFVNQLGENALYHNNGDGTFTDVTHRAGVALGDRICAGATFADTRNFGLPDLFVTSTRGGNVLFRNQGDGTFRDVTREAGLVHVGHSHTAVFFDYDNDGYLDLLVTNTAQWTRSSYDKTFKYYPGKSIGGAGGDDLLTSPKESNILYHNNGDGTFTDVTAKAGLQGKGWSGDVAVFDYNGDGYLDVLITSMFGPAQLYRNNGDGTFSEVTRETLGPTSYGSIGAKVFDFNNDGRLDLLIADMHSDMWDFDGRFEQLAILGQAKKYPHLAGPWAEMDPSKAAVDQQMADLLGFKRDQVVFGNTLFKNLGEGRFQEVSDRANLETYWPWGIATGDFDNDGFEDVFLPSGMGYPFYYWPNQLRINNGNETFSERGHELGIEPPGRGRYLPERIAGKPACRSSRCAAVADFDGDGRLDIVVNNFNDYPYYFRNNLPRKNYIAFRLRGTRSNRDAIGAVVRLYCNQEVMTRQVNPAGGYLSQSSKTVHFGLGVRSAVDQVVITWPSRLQQIIAKPAINKLHEVTEPWR
jgi:hypothetical protein